MSLLEQVTSLKDRLGKFRQYIGSLSIDGNKVDFQTIYVAIKADGLNNSSDF